MRGGICRSSFHVSNFWPRKDLFPVARWLVIWQGIRWSHWGKSSPLISEASLCSASDIRGSFRSDREVTSASFYCVVTAEETHSPGCRLNSDEYLDVAFDADTSLVSLGRVMEHFLPFVMFWTSNQGLSFIWKTKRKQDLNVAGPQKLLCRAP